MTTAVIKQGLCSRTVRGALGDPKRSWDAPITTTMQNVHATDAGERREVKGS